MVALAVSPGDNDGGFGLRGLWSASRLAGWWHVWADRVSCDPFPMKRAFHGYVATAGGADYQRSR